MKKSLILVLGVLALLGGSLVQAAPTKMASKTAVVTVKKGKKHAAYKHHRSAKARKHAKAKTA